MTTSTLEREGVITPPPLIPPSAVHFGPTWEQVVDWDGAGHRYILPKRTLGWQQIKWVADNLLDDEGKPFDLTQEQRRFILWMYAIKADGTFLFREVILQRLKGWG